MDLGPIKIDGVLQANKTMRFVAYTDPDDFSGREDLGEETSDANGMVTLSATPSTGKTLTVAVHTVESGEAFQRFRILNDNF